MRHFLAAKRLSREENKIQPLGGFPFPRVSAFIPSPAFLHRSDVKCWIRKMENADVSFPPALSPSSPLTFLWKGFACKSLVVNHSVSIESLSSVYPFSGSQTKGFDWSRDTAASIYVLRASIPLEIYAADEWENFEKRPTAPLPSRPILICHSFKLAFCPFIYFLFTSHPVSRFCQNNIVPMLLTRFINITIALLREARQQKRISVWRDFDPVRGWFSDSPTLDFISYT